MSNFSYPPPSSLRGVTEPSTPSEALQRKSELRLDISKRKRKFQRKRVYNVKSGLTKEQHIDWLSRARASYEYTTEQAAYINRWIEAYWQHQDQQTANLRPDDDYGLVRAAYLIIEECRKRGTRIGDFPEDLRAAATMIQRRATGLA